MAIRSRLRRAFTRGSQDDPNLASKMSKGKGRANTDPNVYQPGEKMPPLKYRRPAAPEHTALLESFDWAKAWRPRSVYSVYSPMGSRMPSRRNSFVAAEMPSTAEAPNSARRSKDFSRSDDDSIVDSGIGASVAGDDEPPELHDENDESGETNDAHISGTMNDTPFTQEDLELALQRSNIDTTKNDSCASSTAAPTHQHICIPGKCTVFHMDRLHERGTLLTA